MLNINNIHIGGGNSKELPLNICFSKKCSRRQSMSLLVALVAVFCVCMSSLLVSCDSDYPDEISTKKRVAPADSTQSSAIIMNCDTTWGNEIHQDI